VKHLKSMGDSRSGESNDHDALIVANERNLCLSIDERGERDEDGQDDAFG